MDKRVLLIAVALGVLASALTYMFLEGVGGLPEGIVVVLFPGMIFAIIVGGNVHAFSTGVTALGNLPFTLR
jgi:hypothetical protein